METPTLYLATYALFFVALVSVGAQEPECDEEEFMCRDGRCIEEFRRCDFINDCSDGEDELQCPCPQNQWECLDRSCIDARLRCNKRADCPDASDEEGCPSTTPSLICGQGLFRCKNGSCIEDTHRCDMKYDCPDGSDEQSCSIPCPMGDFRCDNGVCIERHRQCDGSTDCNDSSDEKHCLGPCSSYEFRCDDGTCIPDAYRCNGQSDCSDHSDERGCHRPTCQSDQFSCNDGTCLSIAQRCNSVKDCVTGEDEQGCARCTDSEFRCNDGRCIELKFHCDGFDDCGDNGDEDGCDAHCQPDEIVCDIRQCVKKSKKCDRIFDCADGTDEQDCDICSPGEFQCVDGTCLNADKRCDGRPDCRDGSDEFECVTTCRPTEFRCSDGTCINAKLRCNGEANCRDGVDEDNCGQTCGEGLFQCHHGVCIDESFRCDGFQDCLDSSDEINCTCGANEFQCPDQKTCVHEDKRCDRIKDCPDGWDETSCPGQCAPHEVLCPNQRTCISDNKLCDRINDCPDGWDESSCPGQCAPHEFLCPDQRTCISERKRCDRIRDCPDGWDESSCPERCPPGEFLCSDRRTCVPEHKRCDRVSDCPDGYDESECPHPEPCSSNDFTCRDGACIDSRRRCDRRRDCQDGSDEEGCDTSCRENQFRCGSGECISRYYLCNRRYECADGSDERNCQPTTPAPVRCGPREYLCRENGRCLPQSTHCDGKVDCPDYSDESNCAETRDGLNLKTYPPDQIIKEIGKDREVVFQCRDEGPARARVKWSRADGQPLPSGSRDVSGRLEMPNIQLSHTGTYICEAVGYPESTPGSRVSVYLKVEPFEHPPTRPPLACGLNEATCSNGDCIPKNKVCDGRIDCTDGSDEMRCSPHGCEPNEFRCENKKCVLKTWRCDADDDCGDGSDEKGCVAIPGSPCRYDEHQCRTGNQCIPKSFHCDGETDCHDGSDEVGCSLAIILTPPPPMLMVTEGQVYTITCKAVGVPTPEIVWRLNWGHVPEKCTSTSVGGEGTLTCPNAEQRDQGAYSCEAVNVRGGSVFAQPDCILVVKSTPSSCDVAHFNALPPPRQECITCFCFGVASECSSANLYIHQLPPPINVYSLVGVQVDQSGRATIVQNLPSLLGQPEIRPISANGFTVYRSEPNERTILENNVIPYFSMPESYRGNLLKSYGGYLKYTVRPEGRGRYLEAPDVVLSGNGYTLVHPGKRIIAERNNDVTVRFFYGEWYRNSYARRGGDISAEPVGELASREEIMMTLANVDYLLIRAMYDDGNHLETSISNIKMDTADTAITSLGAATYVEECRCPAGYHGLSCERCAPGYHRVRTGPWLGNCVIEDTCQPGYYGDPGRGTPCQICPCPLTSPSNQFGRTCILDSDGQPTCNCPQGYRGRRCEVCEDGYEGNPLVPGSSCRRRDEHCNPIGSVNRYPDPDSGQCICKENVYGALCDKCKAEAFHLAEENVFGCLLCFCMGITNQCQSSSWYRQKNTLSFASSAMNIKLVRKGQGPITQNITEGIRINPSTREVVFSDFPRGGTGGPEVYYWSLPEQFLGDKVTSYGGFLTFTLRYVPAPGGQSSRNSAAIVEIISRNNLHLLYYVGEHVVPDKQETITIPLNERSWQRLDAKPVDRPNFLMALADIQYILIKATYTTDTREAALHHVSMDYAVPENTGFERALAVEHCACPRGYEGLSCEDCASGYTRDDSGIYLGRCQPCQCNGHSEDCDRETGFCRNCRDNTAGDRCQVCRTGYAGDATNRNIGCTPTSVSCYCDPRGSVHSECVNDQCVCKPNVHGRYCDECRPGSFGLSQSLPAGCHECFCSGVSNQCYASTEHYRIQIPMQIGTSGYEFTLTDSTRRETVITEGFIIDVSHNEIGYDFPPVGITGRNSRLFWSLPSAFTGNKVTSYGGKITITQRYTARHGSQEYSDTDVIISGNGITLYWKNPNELTPNQPFTYMVPLTEHEWRHLDRGTPRPASRADFITVLISLEAILVRASYSAATEFSYLSDVAMDTAVVGRFGVSEDLAIDVEKCHCPVGYVGTSCESCDRGYYLDFNDRSQGVFGTCKVCPCNGNEESCALVRERNDYVVRCRCRPGFDESKFCSAESLPTITAKPQPPPRPPSISISISEPTIQIVEAGGSVRYRCSGRSLKTQIPVRISWAKEGGLLPPGRSQDDGQGLLVITNVQPSDSGTYLCEITDGESIVTERAVLTVGAPPRYPSLTIYPAGHQEVTEGSPVEFRCEGSGTPLPTLQWSKEREGPLNPTAVFQDGIFRITSVRKSDESVYVCTGTNPSGTTSERVVLYVREGTPPRQPDRPVRIEPQAFEGNAGETVRLSCTAVHDRRASVRWSRDGGELPASATLTEGGTTLTIYSATAADSGVYICTTVTPAGDTVQSQARVTILSFRSPPTVHIEPDRQTIPQGTSAELRCIASGDPTPSIRWSKAAQELSSNVQIIGQLLRLNNAQVSDRGVYVCIAQNTGGTSQASAIIEVERRQAPSVELYPDQRQTVTRGGSALVLCRITDGIPAPKLTWTRVDGRPFPSNVEELPGGVLRFNQVTGPESGQYLCRAENEAGSASAIADLEMQSLPQIVLKYPGSESDGGRRQYHVKVGQRVRMECSADGDPAPSVSWSRHHPAYTRFGSAAETKESHVYEITRVSPSDAGTYKCEARNSVGTTQERLQLVVDQVDAENEVDNRPPGRPYPPDTGVKLNNEKFTVLEGGSVTMRCTVEDNRERIFLTWIRGNQQAMPAEHRIHDGTLFISNVRHDAAGEYICQGIGQSGNTLFTASSHLEVIAPPRIKLNPTRQVVRPGDNAYISCTATGDQPISLTWVRQDGVMPKSVFVNGGSLQFRGIELSDAGRYRCTARNSIGEADAVADVIIDEQHQVIRAAQREVSKYVGSSVELRCTSIPGARTSWTRDDNRPLPRGARERDDRQNGQNVLELFRVSAEDGGRYFCHSESSQGTSSDFVDLRIERVNDISLHIDASPDVIRVGDTVDIRCGVSGDPSAAVSWSKAGEQLPSNVQTRGNLLRVNNVTPRDGGIYTCTAQTRAGLYKEDYVLTIQESGVHSAVDGSHITTPSPVPVETRSVPYGSAVVMECRTDLEHPVTHAWSRQGGFLPKDAIVDMDTLTIPIVQPSDAGIYICTAQNNAVKMDIPTVLVVKDVVQRFEQSPISFMSLPTLPSAYLQFSVEVSFKPESPDGLILYNGQQPGGSGDFVSFGLSQGHPELRFDVGSGPAIIRSPDPVTLGQWHTVKLDRNRKEGSMFVDGAGPYTGTAAGRFQGLDLEEPLYIGGVPDFSTIHRLTGFSQGFIGCISRLIVGTKEHELVRDATSSEGVSSCDTCATEQGLHCRNNGICQEASTANGFVCICPSGFSGDHCERVGEACFPGACNSGRCVNNEGGFNCLCPIGRKGTRCEEELIVREPAFAADGGYVAYPTPKALKRLKLNLRFKPNEVKNGILIYCAQSEDGKGDFTSLTIHNRYIEFRYDVGSGTAILRSNKELRAGQWMTVVAGRDGREGFLSVDGEETVSGKSPGITRGLNLKTPLYVGGYNQEKVKISSGVGLLEDSKGHVPTFDGCIAGIEASGLDLDLVLSVVDSANVGECTEDVGEIDNDDLGSRIADIDEVNGIYHGNDIFLSPKEKNPCDSQPCLNGAFCLPAVHNASDYECHCTIGFRGRHCEATDTLCDSHRPCQNGGTCISSSPSSYHCLCSLGYGGKNCDQRVEFGESVGFQGDGYLELSTSLLPHKSSSDLESIIIEFSTTSSEGLIFWHGQTPDTDGRGQDFLAVAVVDGHLEFSYELGSGQASIRLDQSRVDDGKRHRVVFHREGRDGSIELDGTDIQIGKSPGFLTMLNTLGNIYLGGLPKADYMTAGKYTEGFSGCIHSIDIQNSGPINLYEKALSAVNAHPCSNDELEEELHRAL